MAAGKAIEELAGKICKVLLPVKPAYFVGRGKSVAICTLSSMDLLTEISLSTEIMDRVAIAGRLLSENKGIDAMVNFTLEHQALEKIILCGREVKGHLAGQALVSLSKNGCDSAGRIIGAAGPNPVLHCTASAIETFRNQVTVLDLVGTTELQKILALVP